MANPDTQETNPSSDIGFTHEDFAALLDQYDYNFNLAILCPVQYLALSLGAR